MNRKTSIAATAIAAILISIVGAQFSQVATANPIALFWLPTTPDTNQPKVILNLPQFKTYNAYSVSLNLTIVKPESWFGSDMTMNYCNGKIFSVQYCLDGFYSQNISVNDANVMTPYYNTLSRTLNFVRNLTVAEGTHTLSAKVFAGSYYWTEENRNATIIKTEIYESSSSSNQVTFQIILPNPTPSRPKPTAQLPPTRPPTPSPTQTPPTANPSSTLTPSPLVQPTTDLTPSLSQTPSENNQTSDYTLPTIMAVIIATIFAVGALAYLKLRKS